MGDSDGKGAQAAATLSLPLEIEDIERLLPHRYPFLLVDRVLELEPLRQIVAIKNVTANEPHFTGHFPDQKIMPGVLIIEAMAQAAAIMYLAHERNRGQIVYLMGVNNAKFRRPVVPGDTLRLEAGIERLRAKYGIGQAQATVNGEVVASAEIKFAASQPPKG